MRKHKGWTRLSKPGDKCSAHWRHDASGWGVRHCGHPTANWPYYAVDPTDPDRATVTHNGRGFRTLEAAFDAVERIVAGELVATNHNCGPTTRRVVPRCTTCHRPLTDRDERHRFTTCARCAHGFIPEGSRYTT